MLDACRYGPLPWSCDLVVQHLHQLSSSCCQCWCPSTLVPLPVQAEPGPLPAAGVSLRAYEENAGLREDWDVLSLSRDRRGDVYVSTMEAKHVRPCLEFERAPQAAHRADMSPVCECLMRLVPAEAEACGPAVRLSHTSVGIAPKVMLLVRSQSGCT